jgi:hypothetical protein
MESKDYILIGAVVVYVVIVYLFSRLGETREIGTVRLFWLSLLLTPVMGLAFYLNSSHRKLTMYTEERYKCNECGYVFSEYHEHCPFCEKEGKKMVLVPVDMFMT